jgi:hypothetical protein
VALIEGLPPEGATEPQNIFMVEYTLGNGQKHSVGGGLTAQQREAMRIDEILKLRASGAGQVVASKPSAFGMGDYTIRFTLGDGTSVDVNTHYPVGTGAERAAIFAETRQLKAAGAFSVSTAHAVATGKVMAILHYTLADGRQVGLMEEVPANRLGADGKTVLTPETAAGPALKK